MSKLRYTYGWIVFILFLNGGCSDKKIEENIPDFKIQYRSGFEVNSVPMDISEQDIISAVEAVYSWHSANMKYFEGEYSWSTSCYYIGLNEVNKIDSNQEYKTDLKSWISKSGYQIQKRDFKAYADNHAFGQILLEYFENEGDSIIIKQLLNDVDSLISVKFVENYFLWWIDAVFMSPPIFSHLGKLTNDERYYYFLSESFFRMHKRLYDNTYQLYYRDERFIDRVNNNGQKIFWLRGNGWVVAGIVRILEYLSEDHPYYFEFIRILNEVCESLIYFQNEDGLWGANIVDPNHSPGNESSGSALICYALSKGVNKKYLQDEKFRLAAFRAWNGLQSCIYPDGRFGFTQTPGFQPERVISDNFEDYGAGAFFMAAAEIYTLRMDDVNER